MASCHASVKNDPMKYLNNFPIVIDCLIEARKFVVTRLEQGNVECGDSDDPPRKTEGNRHAIGNEFPQWLIRDAKCYLIESYKSQLRNNLLHLSFVPITTTNCLEETSRKVADILNNGVQLQCVQGELLNETSDWLSNRAQEWGNSVDKKDKSRKMVEGPPSINQRANDAFHYGD